LNRKELIEAVAVELGDRKVAEKAVLATLGTIQRNVALGNKVTLTGFGSFGTRVKAAGTARNPRTGETVKTKKRTVPTFTAGSGLKSDVADPKAAKAEQREFDKRAKSAASAAPTRGRAASAAAAPARGTATKAAPAKAAATKAAPAKAAATKRTATKAAPARAAATKTAATKTAATKTAATKTAAKRTTSAAKAPAKTATRGRRTAKA
jgi:DNA-binding protein HU-beta